MAEPVDPFENEALLDAWEHVTELVGDASVAKEVMGYLALTLWNLPWGDYRALAEQGATS